MKNYCFIAIIMMLSLSLGACSEDVNKAVELYHQETPLEVDILVPDSFGQAEMATISAVLTRNGKTIENPKFVHFDIWKADGTVSYGMEEAVDDKDGVYSISKEFNQDGLYFVKIHAGDNGDVIMPRKQFIVGELSQEDKEYLKQTGGAEEERAGEGHH